MRVSLLETIKPTGDKQMNRNELIKKMAKDAGISNHAAREAVRSILDGIAGALSSEKGKVTLSGFGTFITRRREAHMGRNPMTGEPIRIATRNMVKFRAGKRLRELV
jgi:DNA-binding protein HU-beta